MLVEDEADFGFGLSMVLSGVIPAIGAENFMLYYILLGLEHDTETIEKKKFIVVRVPYQELLQLSGFTNSQCQKALEKLRELDWIQKHPTKESTHIIGYVLLYKHQIPTFEPPMVINREVACIYGMDSCTAVIEELKKTHVPRKDDEDVDGMFQEDPSLYCSPEEVEENEIRAIENIPFKKRLEIASKILGVKKPAKKPAKRETSHFIKE